MKKFLKKHLNIKLLVYIIGITALVLLLISLLGEEINRYLTYGCIFAIGVTITISIYSNIKDDAVKRTKWLENRLKLWNSISYKVKVAGEKSFSDMPIGIIVYNDKKMVEWANEFAKHIFKSSLVERDLANLNKDLYNKVLLYDTFDVDLYGSIFSCTVLRNDNILFLFDKTEYKNLERKYTNRTLAVGVINIDNLDSALNSLDPQEKAMQLSNIMGILANWCEGLKVYLRGYSEEQYLLLMDRNTLSDVLMDKFKVLDDVRDYCDKENLRISLSIGLACQDLPIMDLVNMAQEQLQLALNRGGDQVVVNIDGATNYYGGKTKSIENRSPIYIRVKTEDLVDIIKKANNVLVMTHKNTDADAFGSSIAMTKLVRSLDKPCHIIFDENFIDQTVSIVYQEIVSEHMNLLDMFISVKDAYNSITKDTLLIIVDTQYETMVIDQKILQKAKNVAVLDHHRRSESAISNYVYLYNQTSASSAVELVVEMYDFLDEEIELLPIEASLMLLGIMVDTSQLMYRTSYRTFNILGKLQMYGAEIAKVQRFLREDLEKYVERVAILTNLEIIEGRYGIAICDENERFEQQFLAKIADNAITINGLQATFCIGYLKDGRVGVSARSLDETNVQTIMEKMGGGGHFNNAATQIASVTISDVRSQLVDILKNKNSEEDEYMKIILIKDVKGKGREGDIVDIPSGHANYLVRSKQAVLATGDNIKMLEERNEKAKEEAEKHLQEMRKLKEFIEANPIKIMVNVGKEGKLFGTVSTKQVVDEYRLKYNVALDKRKIMYDKEIDALGTYKLPIQLHRDVLATITLYVIEKE